MINLNIEKVTSIIYNQSKTAWNDLLIKLKPHGIENKKIVEIRIANWILNQEENVHRKVLENRKRNLLRELENVDG
jgi:hypothetical protein